MSFRKKLLFCVKKEKIAMKHIINVAFYGSISALVVGLVVSYVFAKRIRAIKEDEQ